jgi:glucose/arabinose dehydrogenase/mono/diheme cytochrome c family protein
MLSDFRTTRFVVVFLASSWLATGAAAQTGDRAGEVQNPPPPHLKSPPSPALSPEQALASFRLPPGFRMELVASEPLVFDPVAMAFGPDGRLWVVEMRAYMQNVEGKGENAPIGTVAVLDDTDGDGRMDKRTEFAGGFVLPRAIALVGGGVLVAEPPNLWFLHDKDGDDKVDVRTLVASDYGNASNPEHTANGLLWALDNWIYSANHTVRFRYSAGEWSRENTVFRGQWGITQDDAGRLFYNTNSDPLRMDVLPAEHLRRNPNLRGADSVNHQLAKPQDLPVWPGRITLGVNRGYRMLRDDGTLPSVTAACGPVIYRGATFPREFRGNAFIAEPSANLVKRVLVEDVAGTPRARNAYERSEFLTSTDERFRPVNLYNGPDGGLYVVDMYRGVIQHRIYLTTYLRDQIRERGLEAPVGLGRIWRIVPRNAAKYRRPTLARMSTKERVAALAHPQGWWRDTAQRLLVETADPATEAPLKKLARFSRSPQARLHALWTLAGMRRADWEVVQTALRDSDPSIAAAGARLAATLPPDVSVRTVKALEERAARAEPLFLREMALALGATKDVDALVRLGAAHGADAFMADAIVSSLAGAELVTLEKCTTGGNSAGARAVIAALTAAILQSRDQRAADRVFALLATPATSADQRDALLSGIDRFIPGEAPRRRTAFLAAEPRALISFAAGDSPQAKRAAELLRFLRWRGQSLETAQPLAALSAEERAQFERGRSEFALCAACHQPNGEGMSGLAPALVGSPWVTGGYSALVRIVLNGKQSGETAMPPLKALDDDVIAAILTYIRRSWGHESPAVTQGQVQAVRSEVENREEPWSEAELEPMN